MSVTILLSERRCGFCEIPIEGLHGNARYCSDACKSAAWRARTGYRVQPASKVCQTRKFRSGRSGLQASAPRMVGLLISRGDHPDVALGLVRDAMPARQRDRLTPKTNNAGDPAAVFWSAIGRVSSRPPVARTRETKS